MYRLAWCTSNRADWIALWGLLWRAIVASSDTLLDHLNLPIEARSTTLNQWHICSQTHLVHMPPSIEIIEGIENNGKCSEPVGVELRVLDIGMMRHDFDVGVELMCCLLRHL